MTFNLFFASLDPVCKAPELYPVRQLTADRNISQKLVFKPKLSLTPYNNLSYGGNYYAWHHDVARDQSSGRY